MSNVPDHREVQVSFSKKRSFLHYIFWNDDAILQSRLPGTKGLIRIGKPIHFPQVKTKSKTSVNNGTRDDWSIQI